MGHVIHNLTGATLATYKYCALPALTDAQDKILRATLLLSTLPSSKNTQADTDTLSGIRLALGPGMSTKPDRSEAYKWKDVKQKLRNTRPL